MTGGPRPALITGGAGFIGCNLADQLMQEGERVILFDNLSRPGVERNLEWLRQRHGNLLQVIIKDIRDGEALTPCVVAAGCIFHLAAQVAVTSSLEDPLADFGINAQGTLTVLEAVRRHAPETPLIFASTNKVYGALHDVPFVLRHGRHVPADAALRARGMSEARKLEFCTPYGCSKGAADQYVLDYAHSFGLRTAVLRMSCIYGPRQFGTEDQGWVAHFLISALQGEQITVYGDGSQVRDILHVRDAVGAYRAVLKKIDAVAGQAFNLGGGPDNEVSLRCVLDEIDAVCGRPTSIRHEAWRTGDQLYYVADTTSLREATGWRPAVGWRDGMRDLADWVMADLRPALREPAERLRA